MSRLITLTTDFGLRDPYVAAMKGVLLSLCPSARLADLSHSIAPHSVLEAALFTAGSASYFPKGTVHLIVVDPGVGTARRPIAVSSQGRFFVCPDNGILTLYLRQHPCYEIRIISNPELMRDEVSGTFHGRDIFAPAAARLACGYPFARVGDILTNPVMLALPTACATAAGSFAGEIIHVDRFENLISNISRSLVGSHGSPSSAEIVARGLKLSGLKNSYGDVAPGDPLALWGSYDLLEIAVNQGKAATELGLSIGSLITLNFES